MALATMQITVARDCHTRFCRAYCSHLPCTAVVPRVAAHQLIGARRFAALAVPFRVATINGKGFGVFSTRTIIAGSVVVEERPVLTFHSGRNWYRDTKKQFNTLNEDEKNAVMDLQCGYDASLPQGLKTLTHILGTNSIARSRGSDGGVLCLQISRFNHSCSPNCEYTFDESLGKGRVFASTDISEGDELCISYIDVRAPQAVRSQQLWSLFRFRCQCSACLKNSQELAASDARRSELQQLKKEIFTEDGGCAALEASKIIRLLDEDCVFPNIFRAEACYAALQRKRRSGDNEAARRLAREAYRYHSMCRGAEHADSDRLRSYAEAGTINDSFVIESLEPM